MAQRVRACVCVRWGAELRAALKFEQQYPSSLFQALLHTALHDDVGRSLAGRLCMCVFIFLITPSRQRAAFAALCESVPPGDTGRRNRLDLRSSAARPAAAVSRVCLPIEKHRANGIETLHFGHSIDRQTAQQEYHRTQFVSDGPGECIINSPQNCRPNVASNTARKRMCVYVCRGYTNVEHVR